MTAASVEPDSLDQLQSPEQIALLDAIDKLRNQGLGHYNISLPQLIVCGDQSSGKSSLLEGLTRLRFPTKEGLCTTFATELVLRRHVVVEISCTIIPGKSRSQAEKDQLSKFKCCFASKDDFSFESLIDEARGYMSIGVTEDSGQFFEDVLQIRYSGPELPSLTIVDLPGIIHAEIKGKKGVETVRNLVRGYMADQRSIILAVVSAKSDLQTQSIINYVEELDPSKIRTLGIITKPDMLHTTSPTEAKFIKLARNDEMPLSLGWHVVKNRDFVDREAGDAERDESERQFFSTGIWASLPRSNVGIETLRSKLSLVLLQHIRRELPSVSAAILEAIHATESSLKALGNPRDEEQQQRNYLMGKAQKFGRLTLDALRGLYSDPFFDIPEFSPDSIPATRLRTELHNLNFAFTIAMYEKGHRYQITDRPLTSTKPSTCQSLSSSATANYINLPNPVTIERATFLEERIGNQVRLSRQSGLPLVNPWVISEIFRQQSTPWESIARHHLKHVNDAVFAYLCESLSSTMDQETYIALMREHIDPELERRQQRLEEKLKELLVPYQRMDLMCYDPGFFSDLYLARARRCIEGNRLNAGGSVGGMKAGADEAQLLMESMDGVTNCDILDMTTAYYKKAISIFISNVTLLAVENCLIADLPSLLSPELVLNMDEYKLALIASESEDVRVERAALKRKLEDLRTGKRVLDSQARRAPVKLRQTTSRLQSVTPNTPNEIVRPRTPTARQSSADQKDDLSPSYTRTRVDATPLTPPPSQRRKIEDVTLQRYPLSPPKSPKLGADGSPRQKQQQAYVEEWGDEE